MKFIDELAISIKSGKGGDGIVSFLHSHLNPFSGPDGGNGGRGGHVYFIGDDKVNSLHKIASKKKWIAESGFNGGENLKTGKNGKDLYIEVPLGTSIFVINQELQKEFLGEIVKKREILLILEGGKGGLGNSAFASSVNRTPRYAQKGEIKEEVNIFLELKVIANIGFLGLPNSGKSTLLNSLTNAKARTDDFEFTTLNPQLGVLKSNKSNKRIVIADLPGIIEGASQNRGLGLKFLKHISRCKLLIYVIDSSKDDPLLDFNLLKKELDNSKNTTIENKEHFIIWNKIDLVNEEKLNKIKIDSTGLKQSSFFFISALKKENINILIDAIDNIIEKDCNNEVGISDNEKYKTYNFVSSLYLDIRIAKLKNKYWKISGVYFDKIISENDQDKVQNLISKFLDTEIIKKKLIQSGVKKNHTLLINNQEYLWI